jgi:hypothetical protein
MRCKRKKIDGKRCGARALKGKDSCALHADPNKAAELGSKGGRGRATRSVAAVDEAVSPVDLPTTAERLRDLLAAAVYQVNLGKLDTKTSNALAYTGATLLRAIELSSLESRLAALESRQPSRGKGQSGQ